MRAVEQDYDLDPITSPVVKAFEIGGDKSAYSVPDSRLTPGREDEINGFAEAGAIQPSWDFHELADIYEQSSILPQNVAAYEVNIEGFGYHLEPLIDPDADDAKDKIASAIRLEKAHKAKWNLTYLGDGKFMEDPTELEVEARRKELKALMAFEKARMTAFYQACFPDSSFNKERRSTRKELEVLGNAFWEVVRQDDGTICYFSHARACYIRLLKLTEPVDVTEPYRISEISYGMRKRRKRFRRFVQIHDNQVVYFKEFGDPRLMSAKTGRFYQDTPAMVAEEGPSAIAATEMLHFKIDSLRDVYGLPRWIGGVWAVLGVSAAEDVNFLYFDNKSVPPCVLLVSGAKVKKEDVERVEQYIENKIKGRNNFHKIMVIQAEVPQAATISPNIKMTLVPLTSAQQRDGLFLNYIEQNRDGIGQLFRLPRLLRGDSRDFNRSTADAVIKFTEQQVFAPERADHDDVQNNKILVDLRIRTLRFVSNSPVASDPQIQTDIVTELGYVGALTPEEMREESSKILGRPLKKINEEWVRRPMSLTLAGVQATDGGQTGTEPANDAEIPLSTGGITPPQEAGEPSDLPEGMATMTAPTRPQTYLRRSPPRHKDDTTYDPSEFMRLLHDTKDPMGLAKRLHDVRKKLRAIEATEADQIRAQAAAGGLDVDVLKVPYNDIAPYLEQTSMPAIGSTEDQYE